ncbi:hypothetical protein [Spirillospora sp. CA-128828]|uniref:hypothetical protein n=1 Tax=Spirillospora sp. CA-128828 TaxID=3240033 RepID=UPI003D8A0E32
MTGKATTSTAGADAAEAFTGCMRENGVPGFPGITITGDRQIRLKGGGTVDPLSETYRTAAAKCAYPLPKGTSLPAGPRPPPPSAPALHFTCKGDCPAPPKAPSGPR